MMLAKRIQLICQDEDYLCRYMPLAFTKLFKNIMKKTSLILLTFLVTLAASAQDTKQKEAGIVLSNLNYFGLTYRTGTAQSMWRFNVVNVNLGKDKADPGNSNNNVEQSNFGFTARAGKEKRNKVSDNFEFRYGADVSLMYNYSKTEITNSTPVPNNTTNKATNFTPGINAVIGFNFVIKEKFIVGAEILPGIFYKTGKNVSESTGSQKTEVNTSGFGLTFNNGAALSFMYRF
jgi:hypothetical protein